MLIYLLFYGVVILFFNAVNKFLSYYSLKVFIVLYKVLSFIWFQVDENVIYFLSLYFIS
jgi:hypothetical protein